jgi:thiamine-phosphate pyrophosphorylase
MADERLLRIIDANANRTREALRVTEDLLRFWSEDAVLSRRLKRERHQIGRLCDALVRRGSRGLKARRTATDPGRDSMPASEATRRHVGDVLISNFRRAEEGLRVLEEVAKLLDARACRNFKRSRFRVYGLEQACVAAMERRLARD